MFQMLKGDSQLVHCCATDGHTTPLMFAAKNGKQTHDLLLVSTRLPSSVLTDS